MIISEFRFPLFDKIMTGSMNPFNSSNSFRAFLFSEERFITPDRVSDKGVYTLIFPKPPNRKCSFYYERFVNETVDYCNELCYEIRKQSDPDIIAYLRLKILQEHLKTCLIKTGEVLQEHQLLIADFMTPPQGVDFEKLSNSYIFHLLKVCIAKAYLEVQRVLGLLPGDFMDEAALYSGYAGEMLPVKCFLKRNITKLKNKNFDAINSDNKHGLTTEKVTKTEMNKTVEKSYKIKDLEKILHANSRTIRHWMKNGKIKGEKTGKIWYVTETNLNKYLQNNKLNLTKNGQTTKRTDSKRTEV